jgi:hypothetical protein
VDDAVTWTNFCPSHYPGHNIQSWEETISGDVNVYARVYVYTHNSGGFYYDTSDAVDLTHFAYGSRLQPWNRPNLHPDLDKWNMMQANSEFQPSLFMSEDMG